MKDEKAENKRTWTRDAWIALLVFLLMFAAGYAHLRSLRTDRSAITGIELLYGPAVMLAQGRGFIAPDLLEYPEFRAFVRGDIESLPPDALPEMVIENPSQVASYHRYLVYTVAFFWRLFGISWTSLEPLLDLLLAWSGVAVYGIMRLGMKRGYALTATLLFMISPVMLCLLTELRDFSKAPFMLSMLLGMGWLLKHRATGRQLSFLGMVFGLLAGTGMGFRQDVFVFLPLALVMLIVSAFRSDAPARWLRLGAVPLCLACFYMTAWPMLGRMEGAAHPDHHLVQGFSTQRLDNLGILPASYRPMSSGSDCYVFSALQDHTRRMDGVGAGQFTRNTSGSDRAGRRWMLDVVRRFPADLAARGYAAVLRPLRYANAYPPTFVEPTSWHKALYAAHRAFAVHLHRFGLLYGLLAFAVIAAAQPLLAVYVFLFCLYVFGYIAVQCEYRHSFHLAFLPFWVLGFLADRAVGTVKMLRARGLSTSADWRRAVIQAIFIPAACILILVPPLAVLRYYQVRQVGPLLQSCMDAKRARLAVREEAIGHGWTLFSVDDPSRRTPDSDLQALCRVLGQLFSPELQLWHARGHLYAAEFKADAGVEWLIQKHDSALPLNDFSQLVRLPAVDPKNGIIRYYFPAYELLLPLDEGHFMLGRNRFRGIALPDEQAAAFLGLYEVQIPEETTLLMQFATPGDLPADRLYQEIGFLPDPVFYYQSDQDATDNLNVAEAARRFGHPEQAVFFSRAQLVLSRKPETRFVIAGKLLEDGNLEEAMEAALDIRDEEGTLTERQANLLEMIGRQFQILGEAPFAEKAFAAAWSLTPSRESILRFELAGLYGSVGEWQKSVDNYRAALLLDPENNPGAGNADVMLSEHAAKDARTAFWREITERHPASLQPWLRLGISLEGFGETAAAAEAYAKAYENHPEDVEATLRSMASRAGTLTPKVLEEVLDRALGRNPGLKALAVSCIDKAAQEMIRLERLEDAVDAYDLAARYDPENGWIRLRQAEVAAAAGNTAEARTRLEALLTGPYGREAASRLDLLARTAGESGIGYWQEIDRRIPGNEHVHAFLQESEKEAALSLFESGDYPAAIAALEAVCPEPCADPNKAAFLLTAKFLDTGNADLGQSLVDMLRVRESLKPQVSAWLSAGAERLIAAGQADRAETAIRIAALLAPEDEAGWLRLVGACEARQDFAAALDACHEGLMSAAAIENLAGVFDDLYARLNRGADLPGVWKQVLEKMPGNMVALMHLAMAYETNGQWREAADTYATLAGAEQATADVRLYLGNALVRAGDVEGGLASLRAALEQGGATVSVTSRLLQNAGNALLERGRVTEAETLFRKAVDNAPREGLPWLCLGEARARQGNKEGAIEAWKQVLAVQPDSPAACQAARRIHQLLPREARLAFWRTETDFLAKSPAANAWYALELIRAGALEEANGIAAQLVQNHAGTAESHVVAGLLDCLRGEIETGVERIRNATKERQELVSDGAGLLSEMALESRERGDTAQAVSLLRAARTLEPGNLLYAMHLGDALLREGHLDEAIDEFKVLLLEVPESPRTAGLLDEAFRQKQDPEGQLRAWQEIADAHPEAPLPRQRLEALQATSADL